MQQRRCLVNKLLKSTLVTLCTLVSLNVLADWTYIESGGAKYIQEVTDDATP